MSPDHLSDGAREAIRVCRMNPLPMPTHDWGLRPVPQGPQPLRAWIGDRPPGTDEGYDFISWAESRGFRAAPSLGDWPFVVVSIEPAPAGNPVAALAYIEGTTSLTIWRSMAEARASLPIAFPGPEGD